ncbi:SigE family RNA polymerase sigma factor [Streptomyces phaeolivaceus]|uniref:SigE family RNA polymerase sigma factor n=1 Tax=Streptomyces phaeolivaceus TaxID=2653200 RepID=A0A5P8K6W0_9ACTN|nr:SigE family RNA polymerase sigma factor [Streptomyces phaeolivaceus]QFQ98851.1 SigE family RNA polymerase sigma factor [Streptomyces phaeolivaceus]
MPHENSGPHENPGPPEGGDFAAYTTAAWPRLVRTAHMLTGDFHEAEDLVQTTLAKVYARWRRIPRDDVDFYVRRSLVNNNISRVRKRRVAHLLTPFLPERVHERHAGHADSIAQRAAVTQALAELSARQRSVLVLRFWEDLSENEIAQLLGCSLGTVKTHVRRGLQALRAHPSFAAAPHGDGARDTHTSAPSPPFAQAPPSPVPGARP